MFAEDPAILFEHGFFHEGVASPLVQAAVIETGADNRGARSHLEEANDLYRKAIKERPRFVEARVRHGFVLEELGRHDGAAEVLRLAVGEAGGPQLRYYAELFLARAEESLGNVGAARDHYRHAADLYPQAQSPRLALTLLARQGGDRVGAADAMGKVLALTRADQERKDPWWDYYRWQNEGSNALLTELYRRIPPEGPQ
jgi:tetratricopeptide (TPR) repeat protein